MQNRYAGDIGDYSKFMLLKHVIGAGFGRIGIVWYTYPNEFHNTDGKHIRYLKKPEYSASDQALCALLDQIAFHPQRAEQGISLLEQMILGSEADYFSQSVGQVDRNQPGFPNLQSQAFKSPRPPDGSLQIDRGKWFENARKAVRQCQVVILDPDNGMIPANHGKRVKRGKYANYEEVAGFLKDRSMVIVYQHFGRTPHKDQMRDGVSKFRKEIDPGGGIFAVRFRAYSPRAYYLLTNSKGIEEQARQKLLAFRQNSRLSIGWDWRTGYLIDERSGAKNHPAAPFFTSPAT